MAEPREEWIIQSLRESGHRITQPRRAVIRALLEDAGYSNPSEIHERARHHCGGIGQVTVYRTLDLLGRYGFVRRIHAGDGCHGHATVGLGHGHHLICRRCGAAVEFEGCGLAHFLEQIGGETGYLIEDHLLELVGLCPSCQ